MYERQDGSGLEVGSYAHRPILHDPDEIPSIEESALSPTELPFTQDDFVQQMEHALELMPEIVGDESVGIKYAINGLLSLTPDGLPMLGETPGGPRPLVGRRGVGQGGARRRPRRRRVDGPGRARDRPPGVRHRALLRRTRRPPRTCGPAPRRASTRPTASSTRASSGQSSRRVRLSPVLRARAGARRGLLRGRRLGAPALVRVERAAARGLRRPREAARGGVGRALVVADHQRRAPGDARPRGDVRPDRVLRLRRHRARARSSACSSVAMRQMRRPARAAWSTRRCSRRAAASAPT